jgi:rare lipoprotein A (peptidoglycan hydrolase)
MKLVSQQKLCFLTVALALAWTLRCSPAFAEARVEHGSASWYSVRTNGGTQTASGQSLRDGAATAAHKTLPLGTKVRVTNLANGKSQVVTITDRGPYVAGRVIDVTIGTAERLGFVERGVVPVKVETVGQSTGGEREVDQDRQIGRERETDRDREVVRDRDHDHGRNRDAERPNRLRRSDRSSERGEVRRGTAWGLFTGPRRYF